MPLQDELPEPSPTRTDETTETNPPCSVHNGRDGRDAVYHRVASTRTYGLATPRECSTSQALLTLGSRRPLSIVPQDAPVADADANGDPAPMDADVGAGMSRDHRSYFREATRTPRKEAPE